MKDIWQLISYFSDCYRPHFRKIFLAVVAMIVYSAANAVIPWIMKPLLDDVFVSRNTDFLYMFPLLVVLSYFAKGAAAYFQGYYMSYVGMDIVRLARDRLLQHLLTLRLGFFRENHTGELMSRVMGDVSRIQNGLSTGIVNILRDGLTALGLLTVVYLQSPVLFLMTFVCFPFAVVPILYISKRIKKISYSTQSASADLSKSLSEIFFNIQTVKAYNKQEFEAKNFSMQGARLFETNRKFASTSGLLLPVLEIFAAIAASVVIVIGGLQVVKGELTVGEFFTFMTAALMAIEPIRRIMQSHAQYQDAIAAFERLKQLMCLTPEADTGKQTLDEIKSCSVVDVCLGYGDRQVLRKISFELKLGQSVGIIGPSGSGKTSLVDVLARLEIPSQGKILLNGSDITDYSLSSLRQRISIVSQRIHIFNASIAENVAYGEPIDDNRVKACLKDADLFEFVETLPLKADTLLTEGGGNLSGGQRQKIAIARGLYRKPSLLILDEATSALDNASQDSVMTNIYRNRTSLILIVIAHRLETLKSVDTVLLLADGKVVEHGPRSELLKKPGVLD